VEKGIIDFEYVQSAENSADIFTKIVTKAKLMKHVSAIGLIGEKMDSRKEEEESK
jgi:hypothetical protein